MPAITTTAAPVAPAPSKHGQNATRKQQAASDTSGSRLLPDNRPVMREPSQVDVESFVKNNLTSYDGDSSFLARATEKTKALFDQIQKLQAAEIAAGGVLDVDASAPCGLTAFPAGYIDKELDDVIVGLQTDKPLKRDIHPKGGINMVNAALKAYGFEEDPEITRLYTEDVKTHNQGVFDAYTEETRAARKSGILTGLPDGYGRGRIIGDYRRVALYGVDALVADKQHDKSVNLKPTMNEETIQLREEVTEQIRALQDLKAMASLYGFDISRPAKTAKEAIQWLYFGYLGAVKEQDGAAMSMGRIDAFLDIFIQRDMDAGLITESDAQEMMDHFIMKLRIVNQLRPPEYNNLFAGDPTWVTCVLGGVNPENGRHMVTRTAFRILNTLYTLGPSPEPNLTVLWSPELLPQGFKNFCAQVSIDTSSIQYESDTLMSERYGCDYAIACCVSAMRVGKDMQFFGARCNMPKLLLYVLNQGRDEMSGAQVGPKFAPLSDPEAPLEYDDVMERLEKGMDWLVELYINTMNVIHFMHDKYNYERLMMALHDTHVRRFLALGIAGISVIADSLSAIKHADVTPIFNADGIITDFEIEGDFPKYGNDDERVDSIARQVVDMFITRARQNYCYRGSMPTLSLLTITSNVVYGKKTGNTPDGRKCGEPFAPGANPMHGRDTSGALASLNSVAKIPYEQCLDGISNTFSLVPHLLGAGDKQERVSNLSAVLDGYFKQGGFHININVLERDTLLDAVEHPEKYPNLTVRVSGYAVHFIKLTKAQQLEVISRTFHGAM